MVTSRLFQLIAISIASLFNYAFGHPIEIEGHGDVTSASGNRHCYLEDFHAANEMCTRSHVAGAYQETYYATARPGWRFDHWATYCPIATPPNFDCSVNVQAQSVEHLLGQPMQPLKAVFTPCETGAANCSWQPNKLVTDAQLPSGTAIVTLSIGSTNAATADDIEAGMRAFGAGNFAAAFSAFSRAAEQGDANGQRKLGGMYFMGKGVPQDFERAASWCRRAAEQGDADAQLNLAVMYTDGLGVPQDDKQAASWYRKSAEQGNASAQYKLGIAYRLGRGVPQDDEQAASWNRKAAEQGNAGAQYDLGFSYVRGTQKDYLQALKWYILAAAGGNKRAADMRVFVAGFMKSAQVTEAKRLASEWKPNTN